MEADMLDFNSPVVNHCKTGSVISSPQFSVSPGSNPFDDVIKQLSIEENLRKQDPSVDSGNFDAAGEISKQDNEVNKGNYESSNKSNSDTPNSKVNLSQMDQEVFKKPTAAFFNSDSPFKTGNLFDIGRESMPFNLRELDSADGRPSLLLNQTYNLGRESLGILNMSSIKDSFLNISTRESLGILHHLPGLECGLTTDLNTPTIHLNNESLESSASSSVQNCFNTAFLYPFTKGSYGSPSSLTSLRSTFSSTSFASSEISKIYSLHSSAKNSDVDIMSRPDLMNDAFQNTDEFSKRLRLFSLPTVSSVKSPIYTNPMLNIINSSDLNDFRNRILSLPVPSEVEEQVPKEQVSFESVNKKDVPRFWSAQKTKRKVIMKRRSFCGALDFNEDEDTNFNDSVFIEANHLASKIADGSIVDSDPINENTLETTAPPEELCNDSCEEPIKHTKCDEQTIFKTVDKMLPPLSNPNLDLKHSLKLKKKANTPMCNLSSGSNTSNKNVSISTSRFSETSDRDSSSINISKKSNTEKSKEAKDLLHNLSEILNSTNKSEQQKCEGQLLLDSLASILTQSPDNQKLNSMEDSGHSSLAADVENDMNALNVDKHECYEVLDLRTSKGRSESDIVDSTGNQEQEPPAALDLSMKSRSNENINRSLRHSLSLPATKVLPLKCDVTAQSASSLELSKNNSRPSVNGSVSSNDSRVGSFGSTRSSLCKLRTKRPDEASVLKKGPLKAVIPLGSLTKQKCVSSNDQAKTRHYNLGDRQLTPPLQITPKRLEKPSYQNKKTSTPINHQPKMKPMAASTPDAQLDRIRSSISHQKNHQNAKSSIQSSTNRLSKTSSSSENNRRQSTLESLPKDKTTFTSSDVTGRPSLLKQRVSLSITGTPSYLQTLQTSRRNSLGEARKGSESNMRPNRSNSTGKQVGIMSALSRVRESITKSPYFKSKISFGGTTHGSSHSKQSNSGLSENLKEMRNSSSSNSLKRNGKENKGF